MDEGKEGERARKEDGLREEEGAKEIGIARTKGERGRRRMEGEKGGEIKGEGDGEENRKKEYE